jgi:hypothetical protein
MEMQPAVKPQLEQLGAYIDNKMQVVVTPVWTVFNRLTLLQV